MGVSTLKRKGQKIEMKKGKKNLKSEKYRGKWSLGKSGNNWDKGKGKKKSEI